MRRELDIVDDAPRVEVPPRRVAVGGTLVIVEDDADGAAAARFAGSLARAGGREVEEHEKVRNLEPLLVEIRVSGAPTRTRNARRAGGVERVVLGSVRPELARHLAATLLGAG